MINPKLKDIILDPACGTGGFIINSLEHIRENEVNTKQDEKNLQENIFGFEKKPLPTLLSITNLILHGVDIPKNLIRKNITQIPCYFKSTTIRLEVINNSIGYIFSNHYCVIIFS